MPRANERTNPLPIKNNNTFPPFENKETKKSLYDKINETYRKPKKEQEQSKDDYQLSR